MVCRTHRTVKLVIETWLQVQLNTFVELATVIVKEWRNASKAPNGWNDTRMLRTPPDVWRGLSDLEVVGGYQGDEEQRKKGFE